MDRSDPSRERLTRCHLSSVGGGMRTPRPTKDTSGNLFPTDKCVPIGSASESRVLGSQDSVLIAAVTMKRRLNGSVLTPVPSVG
jgi:hypothetical protein